MLTRIPWLGPWLKGKVEALIAARSIEQAGHHAVIGLAWIGAIFTVSALCQKSRWRWPGPVLVDLTFLAYIAFCVLAILDTYAEFEAFRSSWTAYLTGANVLSAAWAGGLSFLVFLAANKILGYLPLEMLEVGHTRGRPSRPRPVRYVTRLPVGRRGSEARNNRSVEMRTTRQERQGIPTWNMEGRITLNTPTSLTTEARPNIGIDGLAATGKDAVTKLVLPALLSITGLPWKVLDTSALFRAVARLLAREMPRRVASPHERGHSTELKRAISLIADMKAEVDFQREVRLTFEIDSEALTEAYPYEVLYDTATDSCAAQLGHNTGLRPYLIDLERRIASEGHYILPGRDSYTVALQGLTGTYAIGFYLFA